jgi:hypothetical protein
LRAREQGGSDAAFFCVGPNLPPVCRTGPRVGRQAGAAGQPIKAIRQLGYQLCVEIRVK